MPVIEKTLIENGIELVTELSSKTVSLIVDNSSGRIDFHQFSLLCLQAGSSMC